MVQLTEIAVKKVEEILLKRGKGLGIEIGVKTTGCSGLAYTIEYVDTAPLTRDYIIYNNGSFRVWVKGKALPYLNGSVMDWKKQGLNEGFEFFNPNESARCGCGSSFSV